MSRRVLALASAAVLVVVAVAVGAYLALFSSDGDEDLHQVALGPAVVSAVDAVVANMPQATGDTDRDQFRSLLGPPEAFTVALEVDPAGRSSRREEWFYYDLRSVYEFVDGTLVSNLPIEAEATFLILPVQYDPDDFELGSTWDELVALLGSEDGFEPIELEAEFEIAAIAYAGNQLILLFDEAGALFYLEAVPLELGDAG